MSQGINLTEIFIANLIGIIILISTLTGSFWRIKTGRKDNLALLVMIFCCIVSCIADPICFFADGKPGIINYYLVFCGNTWIFFGNIMVGLCLVRFLICHLNVKPTKIVEYIYTSLCAVAAILLIVNMFTPVVFRVNEQNVYSRTIAYWLYLFLQFFSIIYAVILYLKARRDSGGIKFFSVWVFIVPGVIGALIQSFSYGVSTITPFIAISIACICFSLQNEIIFRDMLTGVFNRYFLDVMKRKLEKKMNSNYTALLIDINGFKMINDTYGHDVGDKALIQVASILRKTVKNIGEVIRYGGDEFIVILNLFKEEETQKVISSIHEELLRFNKLSENQYELSVAIGSSKLRVNNGSLNEFLSEIDRDMYKNKEEYYKGGKVANK